MIMKIKTADLTGPALDWAVSKCLGVTPVAVKKNYSEGWFLYAHSNATIPLEYSSKWSQGGPIIEREGINLFKHNKLSESQPDTWCAHKVVPRPNLEGSFNSCALALDGPTPLIAAMRCFVASRFGDEVDVPEELL